MIKIILRLKQFEDFGNTKFITLIEDVECIIHEIISESNLKTIENNYSDLEISVLSKVQRPEFKTIESRIIDL